MGQEAAAADLDPVADPEAVQGAPVVHDRVPPEPSHSSAQEAARQREQARAWSTAESATRTALTSAPDSARLFEAESTGQCGECTTDTRSAIPTTTTTTTGPVRLHRLR